MQKTKICVICKIRRKLVDFCKEKSHKDGHHSVCRKCKSKYDKEFKRKNRKKIAKKAKKYYEIKKEKILKNAQKYRDEHREENKEYQRQLRRNDPNYTKKQHLKYSFGLSLKEFKKLLKKQNNLCAICGKKETLKLHSKTCLLAVDHDHKTNKIRGLLCSRCNLMLGSVKDSIKLLKKAIKYLKRNQK